MLRLLLVAAAAATAAGIQITDPTVDPAGLVASKNKAGTVSATAASVDPAELMGSGSAEADESGASSGLDPELTNTAGETFHVTTAGDWNLIGMPKDFDPASPETAALVINITTENVGTHECDDLLIRKVTIKGTKLGSNVTCLELSVGSDVFNDTDAIGLKLATPADYGTSYDVPTFAQKFPGCTITRPRAAISAPTKNSWRKRTKLFTATCSLDNGANVITANWATVWRGYDKATMTPIYKNDLEVFVSGVGTDPAGLLGPDDHSAATKMVANCPKKQPLMGPYHNRREAPVLRR